MNHHPAPPDGQKRITLTFPRRLELLEALRLVCRRDGDFAIYRDSHSDETVAASMPFPASPANVANLRLEYIGKLRPPPAAPRTKLEPRVARLEAQVAFLASELDLTLPDPADPLI
jgi:hypothetical protein